MVKAEPCKRCGSIPTVVNITGLYYCQCTGKCKKVVKIRGKDGKVIREQTNMVPCDKWNPYDFLGTTPRSCIESWNSWNSKRLTNLEEENEI